MRMQGILMQLAAATATSGTRRPINGFMFFTALFSVSAVPSAPPVARQYEVSSCLCVRGEFRVNQSELKFGVR